MDLYHPHDSFVRSWLGHPDQLAGFLELCLPPAVFALLDTTSIRIHNGTYIDQEHRQHFSDIAATVDMAGTKAQVYVLVEHKSWNDPWALLQILRYMVQTWTRDCKEPGPYCLVPIIPVLFYHGPQPRIRTRFPELFASGLPPVLNPYQPRFQCDVLNLTTLPDEEIRGSPEQEAALWAIKYARTQTDLALQALNRLAQAAGEAFFNSPHIKDIEVYLLSSSELRPEEIIDRITAIVTELRLREDVMSTAQMLIAQGITQGEARGEARSKMEIARKFKASGMAVEQVAALCDLEEEVVRSL